MRSSCTSHGMIYRWRQSWIVNYVYRLTLAVPWCELIPKYREWLLGYYGHLGLSGSLRYIAGYAFAGLYSESFQVDSHLSYCLLLAPFSSSNNFSLFLKSWPGADVKNNETRDRRRHQFSISTLRSLDILKSWHLGYSVDPQKPYIFYATRFLYIILKIWLQILIFQ